jgi:hypothetical protein
MNPFRYQSSERRQCSLAARNISRTQVPASHQSDTSATVFGSAVRQPSTLYWAATSSWASRPSSSPVRASIVVSACSWLFRMRTALASGVSGAPSAAAAPACKAAQVQDHGTPPAFPTAECMHACTHAGALLNDFGMCTNSSLRMQGRTLVDVGNEVAQLIAGGGQRRCDPLGALVQRVTLRRVVVQQRPLLLCINGSAVNTCETMYTT